MRGLSIPDARNVTLFRGARAASARPSAGGRARQVPAGRGRACDNALRLTLNVICCKIMTVRHISLLLLLLCATALPAAAVEGGFGTGAGAELRAVCRHYENRARFRPREGVAELVVILAESCGSALRTLERGPGAGPDAAAARAGARAYLRRLHAFKALITGINTGRFLSSDAGTRAIRSTRPVSATGEYLIARRFGLISAYHEWLRGAPEYAGPVLPERPAGN
ncbi:hypothetical protein FDP22_01470 [Paroceanicella profunda]|uniref:Uncharacterized protein n=1 Tax=Paroceanicella profunda TaxID=2579971 RepID=A0A5B8FG93_9RHOB|nr:hypothetical protein [Paroceanicella profunda]QDL90568.1 hypothetical protein FDP22_01470 [Paroceanicella profunda]